MDRHTLVTDLLEEWGTGRCSTLVERLRPYFESITLGDLIRADIDVEYVINAAAPQDRFMMRMFCAQSLRRKMEQAETSVYLEGDTIELSNRVCSVVAHNLYFFKQPTLVTSQLRECFSDMQTQQVTRLELRSNYLHDDDLPLLEEFVTELLPNCAFIDLSHNEICGETPDAIDSLVRLLHIPQIEYIIVAGNPIYGSDNTKFHKLVEREGTKLIWIEPHHLHLGFWQKMLPDASGELIETIRDIHKAFWEKSRW